jgi:UDP-N-acetylglucosamine 1-carboxyvinyltransferase
MTERQLPEYFIRLGAAIRRRRHKLGLTQWQLADKIECNRNYVGLVENGKHNLTVEMLTRFAEALGTEVNRLTRSAKF